MDIATHVLKEPNTIQSTPKHKLFPDAAQVFGDIHNVLYKSPKVKKAVTPQTNPKVKRNLNDSFNETPKSVNKSSPHLNYSVFENDNDVSLVLKLQLSTCQPYVNLKRSTEIIDKLARLAEPLQYNRGAESIKKTRRISFADESLILNACAKIIGSTRKSPRAVGRKSYTEFLSPAKIPEEYEDDSIRIRGKSIELPQKRLRSKSVDSNQYDSYGKRIRPRRSSVIQQSYKEVFNEDDSDLETLDSSFPSPAKRTRSKRNIKLRARYIELSDDEIIDGVEELDISDDEHKTLISSSSPKKKAKSSLYTTSRKTNAQVDHLDVEEDKLKLHARNKDSVDRWRNTIYDKSFGLSTKKISTLESKDPPTVDQITVQTSLSVPFDNCNLNDHAPTIPHSNNKIFSKIHSSIPHNTPLLIPKESAHIPKTPSSLDKTSKLSSTVNTTPKSQLQRSTPKIVTNSSKLMRSGVLTPSVRSRATAVKEASTPLNKARLALHVAHVPDTLPCREMEAEDIYGFVEGKLLDGCGGCMYISGVPGTGKTATVTFVIRQLQNQSQSGELPKFDYVSVNGMRLTEPRQSYVEILKQLTGKIVPWEQAQNQLNSKFTKKEQKATNPIVLLIDELDILCTKRQDVVYNLLDWPSKAFCQLIVVTIANTMDLPERLLMGRVTSRLGLTRLTFQAYNHKQLQEIVSKRLYDSKIFNPDAIQLVARKVASVSGDARRALDICRRAAEMAEADGKNNLISMTHVNEALDSMMTQPKIRAIKSSSRLQKLLLQSVVAEIERTGVEETTFSAIFRIFSSVAAIDGFQMVSMTLAITAIAKLGACRLLLLDPKISGLYHRIMLNVSVDDVYYALKSD